MEGGEIESKEFNVKKVILSLKSAPTKLYAFRHV
jgi:hypothetical protein